MYGLVKGRFGKNESLDDDSCLQSVKPNYSSHWPPFCSQPIEMILLSRRGGAKAAWSGLSLKPSLKSCSCTCTCMQVHVEGKSIILHCCCCFFVAGFNCIFIAAAAELIRRSASGEESKREEKGRRTKDRDRPLPVFPRKVRRKYSSSRFKH